MALNIETLKTRALTALVFVLIMLFGLLQSTTSFVLLFTIIHFGCWWELIRLLKKIHGSNYIRYAALGIPYITLPIALMIYIFWHYQLPSIMLIGDQVFYIPKFGEAPLQPVVPCVIIASIWINDTMAYLVGSVIGRTPFSSISPKKTWEGTLGGAVLCVVVIGLLTHNLTITKALAAKHWMAIAGICAVFGTAGDLLESKIKRMAGVKDSGSIMPGHGGFLDRFDSLLVAVPFVWLYLFLFLK